MARRHEGPRYFGSTQQKPNSSALEVNDNIFCSPYLAADVPKVLFRQIKDCAEAASFSKNPYTDRQLIYTAIRLLLSTGLYVRAFKG
jgi:hypothetical protein